MRMAGGDGLLFNDRPMVGDVIVLIEGWYPSETVIIGTLVQLCEEWSSDDITYWHAYCETVDPDFSLRPYYGKSGDIPKLTAHAIAQRAAFVHRYGEPPEDDDLESYRGKCEEGARVSRDRFWRYKEAE